MGEHTPGPWRYFKQGDGTAFHITARPTTKPGNHRDDFATVNIWHEENARLIAAAPELYEALRELVAIEDDWADRRFVTGRTTREMAAWNAARAALAKVSA